MIQMPKPKKRAKAGPAAARNVPAKKTPAKAPPGKQKAPVTHDEKLAALTQSATTKLKHAETFLLTEENFGQLWSVPTYYVPTGSLGCDRLLGIPGLPGGRLVEVYGPNSSGKTTWLIGVMAQAQNMGGVAVFIDAEQKLDLRYAKALGLDTDRVIFTQTVTMESVFECVDHHVEEARKLFGPGVPIVVGWDSVAGTPTAEEYGAKDPEAKFRASAAKVLKQKCRTTMATLAKNQALFIALNQVYQKMQQQRGGRTYYSDDDETYGGGAIKYHASIRVALFKMSNIYPRGWKYVEGEPIADPIGQTTGVKIVKNQLAAPNRFKRVALLYGQGIDNRVTIFNDFLEAGLIQANGSWYKLDEKFGKTKSWQEGDPHQWWGLADLIAEDPDLWLKLVDVYKTLKSE
jgi:recombination protein RecA